MRNKLSASDFSREKSLREDTARQLAFSMPFIALLVSIVLNWLYDSVHRKYDCPLWDNNFPLLIVITTLFFLIASAVAFYKAYAHGKRHLRGLLAAILGAGITFVLFVLMTIPNVDNAGEHSHRQSCALHLKQIGTALQEYAAGNDGCLPSGDSVIGLNALVESGYTISQLTFCPSIHISRYPNDEPLSRENITYVYLVGGRNIRDFKTLEPILLDKDGNHIGYGNVLFSDGSVKGFKGEEWKRVCESAGTTLTIIRQEVEGLLNIAPVQVFLDGKASGSLSEEYHLVLRVPYGEHKLSLRYWNPYKRDGVMRQAEITVKTQDNTPLTFTLFPCVDENDKSAFSGEWMLVKK